MLGFLLTTQNGLPTILTKWFNQKKVTSFPLSLEAVKDFKSLKQDIANASLQAIDEYGTFVDELPRLRRRYLCNIKSGGMSGGVYVTNPPWY